MVCEIEMRVKRRGRTGERFRPQLSALAGSDATPLCVSILGETGVTSAKDGRLLGTRGESFAPLR